jgi:hypothetical protein
MTSVGVAGARNRHCEERSDTKQSILSLRGAMDCFAALAMTWWDSNSISLLVVARLDRAIQYSRDSSASAVKPRRTGSPGQAGR